MAPRGHAIDGGDGEAGFGFGWASAQGRRESMEDEIISGVPLADGTHMWAVLDGHAGRRAVELLREVLPSTMREAFDAPRESTFLSEAELTGALKLVDERVLAEAESSGSWDDGATALLAFTAAGELQIAQLGDSQAVLCSAYGTEALCPQHRVGESDEDARIHAAGAQVDEGRVCGTNTAIAVTRSLGDLDVKRTHPGAVVCTPHVTEHVLTAADELLILGCDGLWDVIDPDDAWETAKRAGRKRNGVWHLEAAARALVASALEAKTGDNVSVLVVSLRKRRASISLDHRQCASRGERRPQPSSPSQPSAPPAPQPLPKPPSQPAPRRVPSQQQLRLQPANKPAPSDLRILLNARGGLMMVKLLKPPPMRRAPVLTKATRQAPAPPLRAAPARAPPSRPQHSQWPLQRAPADEALKRPATYTAPRAPPAPRMSPL